MDSYKNYRYLNMANEKRAPLASKKDSFWHLLFVWILPFILINLVIFFIVTSQPDFTVIVDGSSDHITANVEINIKSAFPRKSISASIHGEPLELYRTGKSTYTVTVTSNGSLEVTVVNVNGMSRSLYETITVIDDAPPVITAIDTAPGYVEVQIEDLQAGVDFSTLTATEADGTVVIPALLDEGDSRAVFNYDSPSLEIRIKDKTGHESIATFDTTEIIEIIE